MMHNKHAIDMADIIGKPYGSFFRLLDSKTGKLEQITDHRELVKDFFLKIDDQDGEETKAGYKAQKTDENQRVPIEQFEVRGDNRNITDDTMG